MKCLTLLIYLTVSSSEVEKSFAILIDAEKFADEYYKIAVQQFFYNPTNLDGLQNMTTTLFTRDLQLIGFNSRTSANNCLICYVLVKSILNFAKQFGMNNLTRYFIMKLCLQTKMATKYTSREGINILFPYLKYIAVNGKNLSTEKICSILYQHEFCIRQKDSYIPLEVEKSNMTKSKSYSFVSSGHLSILHLTDFHYDPVYVPGSDAFCPSDFCCRGSIVEDVKAQAGQWGDYRSCDTPGYVLDDMLLNALSSYKIDLVYITGDYLDHHALNKTRHSLKNSMKVTADMIKRYFPNVPVFTALGNHDTYPFNMFTPTTIKDQKVSSQWFYGYVANLWKDWLPKEGLQSFLSGGYYTTLATPKLRIIVLNSNMCYKKNFWLTYDDYYFRDQLEWLLNVLKSAEKAEEKVHILSHIPSNDMLCYRIWTAELKKIIERYSLIIAGEFNGHSHFDEFCVFYSDRNPNIVFHVAWNGGSASTINYVNTNYKVIFVDNQTYEVLDSDTWIFNLTEANQYSCEKPRWYKEYSFQSYFNVQDLSPASIGNLVNRFRSDKYELLKYWKIKIKTSDPLLQKGCHEKCRQSLLTSLVTSKFPEIF